MNRFDRKTFGRIYVADPARIADVSAIVKELDEYEHGYMPADLIAPWTGKIEPVYVHKFEANIEDLTTACWNKGIWIFCVTNMRDPMAVY